MVTFRRDLSRTDQIWIGFHVSPYLELCSTGYFDGLFRSISRCSATERNLAKFEFKVLYAEGCMAQDEGRQKKRGEQGEPRTFCQSTCALLRIMVTMEWGASFILFALDALHRRALSKHLRGTPNVHRNPRRPPHVLSSAWSSQRSHLTRTSYKNDVSRNHPTYIRPANMERPRRALQPR